MYSTAQIKWQPNAAPCLSTTPLNFTSLHIHTHTRTHMHKLLDALNTM